MSDFIEHTTNTGTAEQLAAQIANIAVPPAPTGGARSGGQKMMKNPVDGTQVSRTDYMRALAAAGWTRPQIAAHVSAETGEEVRYQTVHQAVKDYYPKRNAGAAADGEEPTDDDGEFEE